MPFMDGMNTMTAENQITNGGSIIMTQIETHPSRMRSGHRR